jgi:hypothetical protein
MWSAKKFRYTPALLVSVIVGAASTISANILMTTSFPFPVLAQNIPPQGWAVGGGENFPRGSIIGVASTCFLKLQDDGNLVLYNGSPDNYSNPLWASNTNGRATEKAVMQYDGNFVLYGYDGVPVWASNTERNPGAWLIVQEDCNVVIYDTNSPGSPRPIWATNTNR